MWAKLEDELFDHRKVLKAGAVLGGTHGTAAALGFYAAGLMYANRHLTDGFLPDEVVRCFPHSKKPLEIVEALIEARLLQAVDGGYQIHDFSDHNFNAKKVKEKRKRDRDRKRREREKREESDSES